MSTGKRPPGRPKSDAKNRRIFAAAVELFSLQGYDETRVETVAERAGVSKQTVYSHFGGKDRLFAKAMTFVCEQLGMPEGLARDRRPPAEVLNEIGGQFLRLLLTEESRRLYRLILSNVDRHPQVAETFYRAGPRTFIERLAGYLEARTDDGMLAVDDPELAAAQFFSLMRGELHMRAVLSIGAPTQAEIDRYVDNSVSMFIAAYSGKG